MHTIKITIQKNGCGVSPGSEIDLSKPAKKLRNITITTTGFLK